MGNLSQMAISIEQSKEDHRAFIPVTNTHNNERAEIESFENDLYTSVRFGLDIIREILNLHDAN